MLNGLTDVILDPELGGGTFKGSRITESFDDYGRAQFAAEPFEFSGNIQPAPGRERELLPEGDREKETLLVFTPAALSAGQGQNRADRLYYQGNVYRVALAEAWREHAAFTKALAVLEAEEGAENG